MQGEAHRNLERILMGALRDFLPRLSRGKKFILMAMMMSLQGGGMYRATPPSLKLISICLLACLQATTRHKPHNDSHPVRPLMGLLGGILCTVLRTLV